MFVHDAILEALTCGDTQIDIQKENQGNESVQSTNSPH